MENEGRVLRILVADDDPSLRLALTLLLERRGHIVTAVDNTDDARRIVAHEAPQVVLIDAGMPRNGVVFWQELEAAAESGPAALLLTGDVFALGELAAHPRVVEKPFDFGALMDRVERMGAELPA